MSNVITWRYRTEGLIEIIELYYRGVREGISHFYLEAIIDKLRAGDNLCEVAKKMLNGYRDAPHELACDLRKAIADYEGKEEK